MSALCRFLLAGTILWLGSECRSLGKGYGPSYEDFMLSNLPLLLQQMKTYDWEDARNMGRVDDSALYQYDTVPSPPQVVPNWPQSSTKIGQVGGLAVDADDNLVVFHRADRVWDYNSFPNGDNVFRADSGPIPSDVVVTIDRAGNEVSSFGSDKFLLPHGLTIDKDSNLWVTDVGLHQVMKFAKDDINASLVLGVAREPGSDDTHFCKPTDVAVASNGDFFVADGYCNSRIMKFFPNGTLQAEWGHNNPGTSAPKPDEFLVPHSLALDESRDLLCVADREHSRIECFSAGLHDGTKTGTFKKSFEPNKGHIFAIEYDPNADVLYAVNGPGYSRLEGFTLDMDGNVLEEWAPATQHFGQPHDVTVSRDGRDVYVGDVGNTGGHSKVWKLDRAV